MYHAFSHAHGIELIKIIERMALTGNLPVGKLCTRRRTMKTMALVITLVVACSSVTMAGNEWYSFLEKYGIRSDVNTMQEEVMKSMMFRDPDSMKGRRVVFGGLLDSTKKLKNGWNVYYLVVRVPFSEPARWEKIAFMGTDDHHPSDFLMCVGMVLGKIKTETKGSSAVIPAVLETECVRNR